MSEIGKIAQLTTHAHPLAIATRWSLAPPTISLAEHDRTMRELVEEIAQLRRDRVHAANVLSTFRDAPLSISSVQPILTLADALCGPKETPHAENL